MKKKKGFTLVELVIVIAVIAVLAAVLIPTFITVINNANNSADLQLVTNMNTVLVTDLDSDQTATSENLRKLLRDNGISDLSTKNKDNVILYSKESHQFELVNLKDTAVKSASASSGATFMAANRSSAEPLIVDAAAYSPEEIFKGYIFTSTGGNEFAQALYQLHNLAAGTDVNGIMKTLNKKSSLIGSTLSPVLTSSAYYCSDGQLLQIVESGNGWQITAVQNPVIRVVFAEDVTEISLDKFTATQFDTATIILPNTIQSVTYVGDDNKFADTTGSSTLRFAGNLDLLNEFTEGEDPKIAPDRLMEGSVEEVTRAVAELGAKLSRSVYYVSASENATSNADDKEFTYKTVSGAIAAAAYSSAYSGKKTSVVIADKTFEITEDITVPKNVTLDIPFYKYANTYFSGESNGADAEDPVNKKFKSETSIVDDGLATLNSTGYKITKHDYNQFTVTLAAGKKITVDNGGKLQIGGVTSHTGQYYQGHTSGYYGQLNLSDDSQVIVNAGGVLDTYGYIKSTNPAIENAGKVVANYGGSVYQPFIVTDYSGGSNTLSLYMGHQSPFLRYAMLNIQSPLTVNYGGLLWAHCNLYTGAGYNKTDEVVIGYGERTSQTKGLITLENNAYVECTYSYAAKMAVVSDNSDNNLKGDIGKTKVTIHGDARTEALSLLGLASTQNVLFPVPFNFDFVLANGNFKVYNSYVILPGATVTVNSGATLTVTEGASFYVMDYLYQGAEMSGKTYPTAEQLGEDRTAGILTVNGTFEVLTDAKVGGIIRTDGTGATLKIGNADVSGKFEIGGVGMYAANTSTYAFPLRVFDVDSTDMADYKNTDKTLKPANVPANSKYTSADGTQTDLSETTAYYYYKKYSADDTETAFPAPGGQYVNKQGANTVKFSANFGFTQSEGELLTAQINAFTGAGYATYQQGVTFDMAEKAIDAYYNLSPKARKQVKTQNGFDITSYTEDAVTSMFQNYTAYAKAFATQVSDSEKLDVALAVTAAWNKYQTLSSYVKALISEKIIKGTDNLEEKAKLAKNIVLFTVEYNSNSGVTYPTVIANAKTGDGQPETVSLEPYTKDDGDNKIVYFTADLAPEAVEMKDASGASYGTTDPAGTLFYEVWENFVSGDVKSSALTNTNVKIVLYKDITLLQTKGFTPSEETTTKWGNFAHIPNMYQGSSTTKYFAQNLRMYSGNVSLNLNDHMLRFMVKENGHSTSVAGYYNHISNMHGSSLTITNGTIDAYSDEQSTIGAEVPFYFIESAGPLVIKDVILNTYYEKMNLQTGGILIKYQNAALGSPESYGNATIENVTINGNGHGTGIKIEGGYATINNVDINANNGIQIDRTGNGKAESMPQNSEEFVTISNSTVIGRRALYINGTTEINPTYDHYYNTFVNSITDSKFASSSASGKALEIVANSDNKVEIGNITNCSFASAGTAMQSTGSSGNNVVITTIEGCTITGDSLMDVNNTVDVYGINLAYTTVQNLKNTAIVASAAGSKKATAVELGAGSSLNMIVDKSTTNWFAAYGNQNSKMFNGSGATVNGVDLQDGDLSSKTEFRGGYDCHKLVQPTE